MCKNNMNRKPDPMSHLPLKHTGNCADLLLELGTEEMPPAAIVPLAVALKNECTARLKKQHLSFGDAHHFATPRRLAVWIESLSVYTPKRRITKRGPAKGAPQKAIDGFAGNCGVKPAELVLQKKESALIFIILLMNKPDPYS